MKRQFAIFCAAALLLLMLTGCAAQESTEKIVVTSFYPMYVFTLNVTRNVPGVRVQNMADNAVGCLHDYALRPQDMAALEGAFAFVVNGGGMEQFMERVLTLRDDLPVIDACEGIELLYDGHSHEHGEAHEHGHEHEVPNAHVWLDVSRAMAQVSNIAKGLAKADPQNAESYLRNADIYNEKLAALDAQMKAALAPFAGSEIVTFHEAFTYFAQAYGLHVAGVIENEPGEEPGTRELTEICDLVIEHGVTALFVEPQYPQKAAETISRETGAAIYLLDPGVTGDGSPESYENTMRSNAAVLTEALKKK